MRIITEEKKQTIKELQEAVGRSVLRLQIIKNINRSESVAQLRKRLRIPQSTISKAISRFETYNLINFFKKKGNSEVYDKSPMLKQLGIIDRWISVEFEETEEVAKSRQLKVKPRLQAKVPYIDLETERDAMRMAEPYVILYLFENSVRNFINHVLASEYDSNWWTKVVSKGELLRKVDERRKLEGIHKWHMPRGAHEIFYTDLDDLTYFFRKENAFKKYLDVDYWDTTINIVVKLSRNIVDHHNPLPQREVSRLRQILEDWKRQLT